MNLKSKYLSLIPLTLALLIGNSTIADAQETREGDDEFCFKFPYNQKCKDFVPDNLIKFCAEFPKNKNCVDREKIVTLDKRKGESFFCTIMPNINSKWQRCKVLVEDKKITLYLEYGEEIKALDNKKDTKEMAIELEDVFSFDSPWWIADVEGQKESIGMFADIQIGYLLKEPQGENKTNFITISANKYGEDGFSNKNIPKILEKLEPWLYHNPDIAAIAPQLKARSNNTDTEVSNNIQRLIDTKECPRCDLTNADLSGVDLEGANLEGANLERANLEGSKLKRSYLLGANLDNALLYKANLENSIMLLSSLENSDLESANLQATNLQYSNLNNANLTQAKLDVNGLNVTRLQNASLIDSNLTEANLKCANLSSANLKNANLTQANLEKCNPEMMIGKGELSSFLLNKAKVSTPLGDTVDTLAIIGSVVSIISNPTNFASDPAVQALGNIGSRKVKFIGSTNLSNANLSNANFTEAKLKSADLFNSNLNNATLEATELEDADLNNSNLIDAKVIDTELEAAFLCNAIMPDISVSQQGCDE